MRPVQTPMSLHLAATALLSGHVLAIAFALAAPTPLWGRVLALATSAALTLGTIRAVSALQPARRRPRKD